MKQVQVGRAGSPLLHHYAILSHVIIGKPCCSRRACSPADTGSPNEVLSEIALPPRAHNFLPTSQASNQWCAPGTPSLACPAARRVPN